MAFLPAVDIFSLLLAAMIFSPSTVHSQIPGVNAIGDLIGEQFDTNEDGKIDNKEWQTGVNNSFDSLDADDNGSIEPGEIDELGEPIRKQFGDFGGALVVGLAHAIVDTFDTDNNKTVSREEYDKETKKFFTRLDVDDNGSVSEAELRSLPTKLLEANEEN
jgi:Ca2+-binding EF-hand superfamily protein